MEPGRAGRALTAESPLYSSFLFSNKVLCFFFICFAVLVPEPRASHMLRKLCHGAISCQLQTCLAVGDELELPLSRLHLLSTGITGRSTGAGSQRGGFFLRRLPLFFGDKPCQRPDAGWVGYAVFSGLKMLTWSRL